MFGLFAVCPVCRPSIRGKGAVSEGAAEGVAAEDGEGGACLSRIAVGAINAQALESCDLNTPAPRANGIMCGSWSSQSSNNNITQQQEEQQQQL